MSGTKTDATRLRTIAAGEGEGEGEGEGGGERERGRERVLEDGQTDRRPKARAKCDLTSCSP